jgi:hypothetical protein
MFNGDSAFGWNGNSFSDCSLIARGRGHPPGPAVEARHQPRRHDARRGSGLAMWRKSTYSKESNCAEVAAWRTSSHSMSNGQCAEVAAWRTSTASANNGACAEVGTWRKSSHSADTGQCAEVGQDGTVVLVRDTEDPDGTILVFGPPAWTAFLAGLRPA